MAIERNSDAWTEADQPPRREALAVDFLSNHPENVYTLRELANELEIADWEAAVKHARDREEMDHDSFYEKYPLEEYTPSPASESSPTQDFYQTILRLEQFGLVDIREVDADAFDEGLFRPYPEDIETVLGISYAADQ